MQRDATPPPGTRDFFDPEKLRANVFKTAKEAFAEKLSGLESHNYILKAKDLHYPDPDKGFTIAEQKKAILERRDLTVPLRGTLSLIDKRTGTEVAKKETVIAHIPYITARNTSIYNGSEYAAVNQQRLLPGVYTRIKDSGESEAHINVESGTGAGARLVFEPAKETFTYTVQNTKVPLYGILRDLGVSDTEMEKAWGKEIFHKNKNTYTGSEIDKLHDKIFNREF
jgi:DNA-directed RNA polymerase beta subunit